MQRNSRGFTLVELIVVIAIIGLLATIGVLGYRSVLVGTRATKIVADYKQIKQEWEIWTFQTNSPYPHEDTFATSDPVLGCEDEPFISQTVIQSKLNSVVYTPWGYEYAYDNDNDVQSSTIGTGVNLFITWCANGRGSEIIEVAEEVDKVIDNGDGNNAGNVRWNTDASRTGNMVLVLSPRSRP